MAFTIRFQIFWINGKRRLTVLFSLQHYRRRQHVRFLEKDMLLNSTEITLLSKVCYSQNKSLIMLCCLQFLVPINFYCKLDYVECWLICKNRLLDYIICKCNIIVYFHISNDTVFNTTDPTFTLYTYIYHTINTILENNVKVITLWLLITLTSTLCYILSIKRLKANANLSQIYFKIIALLTTWIILLI